MYKNVMVIDDNAIDRYTSEVSLKRFGFAENVILKESAADALEYLRANALSPDDLPSLIFLDINMPEINGFEFLEAYEKLPETVHSRCIIMMLSTSLNPEDHEKAKSNKFVKRFLNKPLMKHKLSELLNE